MGLGRGRWISLTQAHDEFELSVDVGDGQVDFRDAHLHTSVDVHQLGDVGREIEVGLEVVHIAARSELAKRVLVFLRRLETYYLQLDAAH